MAESDETQFSCPHCGKVYRWKSDIAGKRITCRGCDAKVRIPESPDQDAQLLETPAPAPGDGDIYELDLPDDEPDDAAAAPAAGDAANSGKCPSCNQAMKPGAVLCLNCGYNVAEGKKVQTVVAEDTGGGPAPSSDPAPGGALAAALSRPGVDRDGLRDETDREHFHNEITLPLIIGSVGFALVLLNALLLFPLAVTVFDAPTSFGTSSWLPAAAEKLATFGLQLVVQVPCALLAIWLGAKLFGTSFGSLSTALLKLLAIVVIIAGINDVIDTAVVAVFGELGACVFGIMQLGVSILVFMMLVIKFFDCEGGEAFVLWLLTAVLPYIILMLVGLTLLTLFH